MFIIIEGDWETGFKFYGPYNSYDEAQGDANTSKVYNRIVELTLYVVR